MSTVRLVLPADVDVLATGVRRGPVVARMDDPVLLAALAHGVDVAVAGTGVQGDVGRRDGDPATAALDRLHRRRLLAWRVPGLVEAAPLVAGVPLPVPVAAAVAASAEEAPLSRFALLRRSAGAWVLESGRSRWQVRCSAAGVAALADLALAGDRVEAFLAVLGMAGMLDVDDASAGRWAAHDRWFAARSRLDLPPDGSEPPPRHGEPDPLTLDRFPGAARIALPVPAGPEPDEPTLWRATESRRTVRAFVEAPVPLPALGSLLWRTLRYVRRTGRDPGDPTSYDRGLRPVPSGGAMHGIDLWLLCTQVEAVPSGVWWYDPVAHALVDADRSGAVLARWTAPGSAAPAVTGLMTVRHGRAGWKYGGIAYALELKDVGVVMHALQLTAGALGLGMCPLGSGRTEAVAAVLGVDPEVDAPVGEFLLGVAPPAAGGADPGGAGISRSP